jgi:hypothetical protein
MMQAYLTSCCYNTCKTRSANYGVRVRLPRHCTSALPCFTCGAPIAGHVFLSCTAQELVRVSDIALARGLHRITLCSISGDVTLTRFEVRHGRLPHSGCLNIK